MRAGLWVGVVLLSLAGTRALAGGETGVFPVVGRGLTPGEEAAIGAIFADAYTDVSAGQVVPPADTAPIFERAGSPVEAARALALFTYVELSAVRDGPGLRVTAELFDADGGLLHRASLEARGLEDFERVAPRLAAALFYRRSTDEAVAAAPTVSAPSPASDAAFIERTVGLKLQLMATVASGGTFDPTVALSFAARLEGERYFLDFGVGVLLATNLWNDESLTIKRVYGMTAELGANYYLALFADGEVGLYAGGGFVPRLVAGDFVDFGVKMALYGQAGATFLRTSNTKIYAEARVAQHVLPFLGFDGRRNVSREFYPTELGLAVGIGW